MRMFKIREMSNNRWTLVYLGRKIEKSNFLQDGISTWKKGDSYSEK